MRMFRLLRADEIETRVAEVAKDGTWLTLLLYKTARTDASILDETVGPMSWANDYKVINDNMYCAIGIRSPEIGEWVWKWNVGTESNTEAEKGEASDAMKRAGFVWGIGTELYSAPRIYLRNGDVEIKKKTKGDGFTCYDKFDVTRIEYDENERIKALEIVNAKTGKVVYTYGAKGTRKADSSPAAQNDRRKDDGSAPGRQTAITEPEEQMGTCKHCGKPTPVRVLMANRERCRQPFCDMCTEDYIAWKKKQAEGKENNNAQ